MNKKLNELYGVEISALDELNELDGVETSELD
jgi:hypothetical protein